MNETVTIYIQTFNLLCETYCLAACLSVFYIRSLTVVILANVEYSQRNILQYYTVLYNILITGTVLASFVAMETTSLIACSLSLSCYCKVFLHLNGLFGMKRKKNTSKLARTINLNLNSLFNRRMDMTFCM